MCQKRDELNSKVDERGLAHDMSRTHEYYLKGKRCYVNQNFGCKK
ncbi:hypothetical protein [Holospora curviuscula]|nr:hypothetical protein [Holospora curviuscula]